MEEPIARSLYRGLKALSKLSFPKVCATCGRRYEDADAFITQTRALRRSTGLKEEIDDDNRVIVELFRNCACGSTLMDEFNDRRDLTPNGIKRREKFQELLDRLEKEGYARGLVRKELLNIMRGRGSKLLKVKPEDTRPSEKEDGNAAGNGEGI